MGFAELLIIAIGLSMDAFAIAISIGLSLKKARLLQAFIVGVYFGISQAVMPLIGYLAGYAFADKIKAVDHWVAFALLVLIGGKMVLDSFKKEESEARAEASLKFKAMFPLAIADSIDALAVGVSFAFLKVSIISAALFIGVITLLLSMLGVKIGNFVGLKFKSKAELIGGVILILMGVKTLLEHLGLLSF
ncbi:MAG: manganese efflux pump MntP family protein [Clostridiales Family XIII bacterium]|jgi:putative Mn2+ efflux pump MntP|nr:manganese efflux pump MntP family protein [Clostridiales Family XIII bacterium]